MVLINLHKISIPIKGSEAIIERACQFAEKIKASEEKKLASALDCLAGQNKILLKRKIKPEIIEKFILEQRNDISPEDREVIAKQITPKNAPYLKELLSLPEEVLKARGEQLTVMEIFRLLRHLTPKNEPHFKGLLSLPEEILKARGEKFDGFEISGLLRHLTPKNEPYLKGLLSLPEEILKARYKQLDAWEISGILKQLTPENAPSLKGLLSLPEEVLNARGKKFDGYEIAEMLECGINTEKLEKLLKLQAFDAKRSSEKY